MKVINFSLQFFYSIFLILYSRSVLGRTCSLPNKEVGTCVPLNECKVYGKLVALGSKHSDIESYFNQNQCKGKSSIMICCPSKGNAGFCGRQLTKHFPNRIIGGEETYTGEFPWHALLVYSKPFYMEGHHCGGSLITSSHVVTAAHCTSRSIIPNTWNVTKVRLGESDLSTIEKCKLSNKEPPECAIEINILEIIIHEGYTGQQGSPNDIALLKLKKEVQYTEYVLPVCLPFGKRIRTDLGTGTIIGFGKTENGTSSDKLLKAEIDIQEHRECVRQYSEQGKQVHSTQICASKPNADSCSGDSGGGFVIEDGNSTAYLVGIISYGTSNCDSKFPGVYVKVQNYIQWIKIKVKV